MKIKKFVKDYFFYSGRNVVLIFTLSKKLRAKGYKRISSYLLNHIKKKYGVHISPNAVLPEDLTLPHPCSIVIGSGVYIGSNVTIYQGVTIGGARTGDWKKGNYPIIENDVVIYSGAVLIGDIRVGAGSIVGANSLVNKNFPENSVVVGLPGVNIKK